MNHAEQAKNAAMDRAGELPVERRAAERRAAPVAAALPASNEFEELRKLAMAATPGPWHAPGMGEVHAENHDEIAQILFHTGDEEDMQCGTEADAAFIAAANPATVLRLIELAATPALPAEKVRGLTDEQIMAMYHEAEPKNRDPFAGLSHEWVQAFARAILAASGGVPAPALPVVPEGYALVRMELMESPEMTCCDQLAAAPELPEGNQQPQAMADRDSALHAEPAGQHDAIAVALEAAAKLAEDMPISTIFSVKMARNGIAAAIRALASQPAAPVQPHFEQQPDGTITSVDPSDYAPPVQQPGDVRELPLPEGFVVAPHYRGYAALGTGQYVLNHSAAGLEPEFIISVATEAEKAGRTVGDERDNAPDAVLQPEAMAVRIAFTNVAGLDAMENQLRKLRAEHFPSQALATTRPSAALTDSQCHAIKEAAAINTDLWAEGRDVDSTQEEVSGMFVRAILAASSGALAVPEGVTDAARDVLAERKRQVEKEEWAAGHDDQYEGGELALAAACYATAGDPPHGRSPNDWPWEEYWWKPGTDRRNLVKAGALILADIERIDRSQVAANKPEGK